MPRSTQNRLVFALCILAALVGGLPPAGVSIAAPEPEAIPRRWQLRIQPGELRVAVVDVPGIGERAFLYMTYKVVNNSGEDRDFAPWFDLSTDSGQVVRAGRDVPYSVVEELLKRTGNPFVQDDLSVQGRLLQGEENAREGLVVWLAPDMTAGEYTVFAMGFSGETKTIARPDSGEEFVLRKSLMLVHKGTGRLDPATGRPLERVAERWILR